ncbi:MAG TPA: FliI/YscN family ATPase [Allosphingosinicella sp.]
MKAQALLDRLGAFDPVARTGRVRRILPTFIEADGPGVPLGTLCAIETGGADGAAALAEVVAVKEESVILVPFEDGVATFPGARVAAGADPGTVPVGDSFLGRAVDALSRVIDGGDSIGPAPRRLLRGPLPGPLSRVSPRKTLETGIRAIDGLLTLGKGQRVGVFAASGVGKTSLMAQLARQVDADRCVICLVGERGREVESLWSDGLPAEAKARTTLVAATSDQSAAMRARACDYALALAEHWRSEGHHVLFFLDSVTRLAMALREIGLAAGEPPTVRAYTPSVFATVPKLVERCGALKSGGSITAVMTVLSETDDVDDPVSEMMKSLLDGHIILSRGLAEQGHFPAIDIPRSISRLSGSLMPEPQRTNAARALEMLSTYDSSKLLIEAGVYVRGSNSDIDASVDLRPALTGFLRQPSGERVAYRAGCDALAAVVGKAV